MAMGAAYNGMLRSGMNSVFGNQFGQVIGPIVRATAGIVQPHKLGLKNQAPQNIHRVERKSRYFENTARSANPIFHKSGFAHLAVKHCQAPTHLNSA